VTEPGVNGSIRQPVGLPARSGASMSAPERTSSDHPRRPRGWNAPQAWEESARVRRERKIANEPWGSLGVPDSRLSRLAGEIEAQLALEFDTSKPLWRDKVRSAAELMALGRRARALLGRDPKVTLRQVTASTLAADRLLASVAKNGGRAADRPASPADLLARVHAELRGDGAPR